jgi:hypothetical protein
VPDSTGRHTGSEERSAHAEWRALRACMDIRATACSFKWTGRGRRYAARVGCRIPVRNPIHATPRIQIQLDHDEGSRPDVRVPFAEIALSDGNPPVRLYDTSGPGSDPEAGLPPLRQAWILERGDVEATAARGMANAGRTVLRGRPGSRVTQLAYARAGVVTPEMEFAAIREQVEAEVVRCEIAGSRHRRNTDDLRRLRWWVECAVWRRRRKSVSSGRG